MNPLAQRLITLMGMFNELLVSNPKLLADFPSGVGETQVFLIPLWDEELSNYVMELISQRSPANISRRVVVRVGGSWSGITALEWTVWSYTGTESERAEA